MVSINSRTWSTEQPLLSSWFVFLRLCIVRLPSPASVSDALVCACGFRLQLPPAIEQRGVFYKQSHAGFYPTSCDIVADTLVNTTLTVCVGWTMLGTKRDARKRRSFSSMALLLRSLSVLETSQ